MTCLTWGVFPNKEVQQPTVYDSEVFNFWKEEAFKAWDDWIRIYECDLEENKGEKKDEISKEKTEKDINKECQSNKDKISAEVLKKV